MTQIEQRSTWVKFSNFQKAIEAKFIPKVLTPMQESIKAFLDRGQTRIDELGLASKLIPVLNNLYYQCGYGYGYSVYRTHKQAKLFGIPADIAQAVVNFLRLSLLTNVHGIEASVKESILSQIQQGQDEGWGYEKTAQKIQGVADIARSRRIVRTESVKGSNKAALIGAERTGIIMLKRWISAKDNRVRGNPAGLYPNAPFDHWHMNGVTVTMDQNFNVNGDSLAYPGDPNGSLADIINCRCVIGFVPQTDERGRVIRVRTQQISSFA